MNVSQPQVNGFFVMPWQKAKAKMGHSSAPSSPEVNHLPFASLFPPVARGHFVAMIGEFNGTFLFLFFAYAGTHVANTADASAPFVQGSTVNNLLYISLSFGFSLMVNVWSFYRISGGLFNPAVTFAMCLVGAVPWFRGGLLFISQMLGAMAAAGVVSGLFPGELRVSTTLSAQTSIPQGLFMEMFLTAQLIFAIFMLAAEKHKATFMAPVGIGLALFVSELAGVLYTGGSLNPARSFAPCVVVKSFPSEHWIYWLGPLLGAFVASGFYKLIKMLEYEIANPGQDDGDEVTDLVIDRETGVAVSRSVVRPSSDNPRSPGPASARFVAGSRAPPRSRGRPSSDRDTNAFNLDVPPAAAAAAATTSGSDVGTASNAGADHAVSSAHQPSPSYDAGPSAESGHA